MGEQKRESNPEKILKLARTYGRKLRFYEGLHWYRTYLCHRSDDGDVRAEMHQLQQTEIAFGAAKNTAQWIGQACEMLCLSDARLRQGLTRLTRLLAAGPAEKAIEVATRLRALFESAARAVLDVDDHEEVWESAAYFAAEFENYDLALRFAELSARGQRHLLLYQSLCEAERQLSWISIEDSSLREREKAAELRRAMKKRDLLEITRCLAMFYGPDEHSGGDSPGLGVPLRPRPPSLPAQEKRNWPHSPPPL